jgi:uncharacterized protein
MPIEFDPAKDRRNVAKHGVTLAEAERIEWDLTLVREDIRRDYGETRYLAIGPCGARLFVFAFTIRNGNVRVISLRPAEPAERKRWRRGRW